MKNISLRNIDPSQDPEENILKELFVESKDAYNPPTPAPPPQANCRDQTYNLPGSAKYSRSNLWLNCLQTKDKDDLKKGGACFKNYMYNPNLITADLIKFNRFMCFLVVWRIS